MDDDCYVKNKKVQVAERVNGYRTSAMSNADQLRGQRETILCYDRDDQPMGYLPQ